MWKCWYFGNAFNMQKNIKFLKCASNIYIICTWKIDYDLELLQAIWKLLKDKSNSNKSN